MSASSSSTATDDADVTHHLKNLNLVAERIAHVPKVDYSKPHPLLPASAATAALPPRVDHRAKLPPPYNQGKLGSCTANALAAAMAFLHRTDSSHFMASRLFIYYNERNIEGTLTSDKGAFLSDGVTSLFKVGACSEDLCPYDVSKFASKPSEAAYKHAQSHRVFHYEHVDNTSVSNIKRVLAHGRVIVLGVTLYEEFESKAVAATGVVPMPDVKKSKKLGGHAVVCCGYDDTKQLWIMRNSWGDKWGDKGYFYLPYPYLCSSDHLSSDLWCLYEKPHPAGPPTPIKKGK